MQNEKTPAKKRPWCKVTAMAIFNDWELNNREAAGYAAIDRDDWRLAYDCFMDCLRYIMRERSWDEEAIARYEALVERCEEHF